MTAVRGYSLLITTLVLALPVRCGQRVASMLEGMVAATGPLVHPMQLLRAHGILVRHAGRVRACTTVPSLRRSLLQAMVVRTLKRKARCALHHTLLTAEAGAQQRGAVLSAFFVLVFGEGSLSSAFRCQDLKQVCVQREEYILYLNATRMWWTTLLSHFRMLS